MYVSGARPLPSWPLGSGQQETIGKVYFWILQVVGSPLGHWKGEERSAERCLLLSGKLTPPPDTNPTLHSLLLFTLYSATSTIVTSSLDITMFPRGAGNLEEVPHKLVQRCTRQSDGDDAPLSAQPAGLSALFDTVAEADIG